MSQVEKWTVATSRGAVLTTELDALSSGAYSDDGPEYDNTVNLDMWGILELSITFGSAPGDYDPVDFYTNTDYAGSGIYDTPVSSSTRANPEYSMGSVAVNNTTSAQIWKTRPFRMSPSKMKFMCYNGTAQNFPASGTTVTLYTFNRQVG